MKKFILRLNAAKKYRLYRKMLQTKVERNKISPEKLSGHVSLFIPGMEPVVPKFKDSTFRMRGHN